MANESLELITIKVRKRDVERAHGCKKTHGFKSIKDVFCAGIDYLTGKEHTDQLSENMAMFRLIRQDLHENLVELRKLIESQATPAIHVEPTITVTVDKLMDCTTPTLQKTLENVFVQAITSAQRKPSLPNV